MKDVILTTDLYHRHADPNDHWNLATMFAMAHLGWINFAGIMCDDDRAFTNAGPYKRFGDPSVESIAQLNYITGLAVPVGFGSRMPIKKKEDLEEALLAKRKISSVTLLLETLQRAENKVDIHMCGSCKDVLIAYHYAPDLFEKKCDCIYLNAGTYAVQDPIEYNVALEPYAFSQIFKIPCNIRWSPCFDKLIKPPYLPSERATYYEIDQADILPYMSDALKKYYNYMFGGVDDTHWLTYLREPLDETILKSWANAKRQMWSTPGYLLSAGKYVTESGEIKDGSPNDDSVFSYTPIWVKANDDGILEWKDVDSSNITMFVNKDPIKFGLAMTEVIKKLMSVLPDCQIF